MFKIVNRLAQPLLQSGRKPLCFTANRCSKADNRLTNVVTGRSQLRFGSGRGFAGTSIFSLGFQQPSIGLRLCLKRLDPLSKHARALSSGLQNVDEQEEQHAKASDQTECVTEPLDREVRQITSKIIGLDQDRTNRARDQDSTSCKAQGTRDVEVDRHGHCKQEKREIERPDDVGCRVGVARNHDEREHGQNGNRRAQDAVL